LAEGKIGSKVRIARFKHFRSAALADVVGRPVAIYQLGLPSNLCTSSPISTHGCFSAHHIWALGFIQDESSKVPAFKKRTPGYASPRPEIGDPQFEQKDL
jgi:hypothetical protein